MRLSRKTERLGYVATVLQVIQDSEKDAHKVGKKENVCTLCEEFAAQALSYLNANKTQNEIKDILHESCSKLQSFEEEVFFSNFKGQRFSFFFFLETTKINILDYHALAYGFHCCQFIFPPETTKINMLDYHVLLMGSTARTTKIYELLT